MANNAPLDARRLQTGHFPHRIMQEGKQLAAFTLGVRANPDGTSVFTGAAQGLHPHWESSLPG